MGKPKTGTGRGSPGKRRGRRGANASKANGATRNTKPKKLGKPALANVKRLVALYKADAPWTNDAALELSAELLDAHLTAAAYLKARIIDGTITSEETPVLPRVHANIQKMLDAAQIYALEEEEEDEL